MPTHVYWDNSFKVRALKPTFKAGAILSPTSIGGSGGTQELSISAEDKLLVISRDIQESSNLIQVELSLTTSGSPVYETGVLNANLNDGPLEVALEGIKYVRITNQESGPLNINFMIYKSELTAVVVPPPPAPAPPPGPIPTPLPPPTPPPTP